MATLQFTFMYDEDDEGQGEKVVEQLMFLGAYDIDYEEMEPPKNTDTFTPLKKKPEPDELGGIPPSQPNE